MGKAKEEMRARENEKILKAEQIVVFQLSSVFNVWYNLFAILIVPSSGTVEKIVLQLYEWEHRRKTKGSWTLN